MMTTGYMPASCDARAVEGLTARVTPPETPFGAPGAIRVGPRAIQ